MVVLPCHLNGVETRIARFSPGEIGIVCATVHPSREVGRQTGSW